MRKNRDAAKMKMKTLSGPTTMQGDEFSPDMCIENKLEMVSDPFL